MHLPFLGKSQMSVPEAWLAQVTGRATRDGDGESDCGDGSFQMRRRFSPGSLLKSPSNREQTSRSWKNSAASGKVITPVTACPAPPTCEVLGTQVE